MLQLDSSIKLNFEDYEKNLRIDDPYVWINTTRMIQELDRQMAELDAIKIQLEYLIFRISGGYYRFMNKDNLIGLFTDCLGVDRKKFGQKSKQSDSVDAAKVINPLLDEFRKRSDEHNGVCDDIVEFLELYLKQSHLKSTTNNTRKHIINLQKSETETSNFGQCLKKMSFIYERRQNCRYYTSNSNIQALAKEYLSTIEMPKGYIIVAADASQADFREACEMIFLQDREFKKIYDEEEDKYKALAKYIKKKNNKPWDEEEFQENRKGYKTSTLAKVYGGHSSTSIGSGFKNYEDQQMLESFIEDNPAYKQYCLGMQDALNFQHEVVTYDVFGNPSHWSSQQPKVEDKLKNAPIQSTTSAIVIAWSTSIISMFRERGYGEDKFGILLNRHDELLFYMHIDALKDSWIFKQNSSVGVDDWGELCFEPDFYFAYKMDCPELMQAYENSCKNHEAEITPFERKILPARKKYRFTKKLCRVYTYAPVSLYDFCKLRCFPDLDLSSLENYKKSEVEQQTAECKQLVRNYLERNDIEPYVRQDLINYKKYWNYFVIYDIETFECKVLKGYHNYLEYLKNNDYGYIICNNTITDIYINLNYLQIQNYINPTESVLDRLLSSGIDGIIEEEEIADSSNSTEEVGVEVETPATNESTNVFSNKEPEVNSAEIVRIYQGIPIYADEMVDFDSFSPVVISQVFGD